ncbi:MAG TPA: PilZ domain-containing protein [Vicinamibacterales bacterium]|nr:PilZ domain-containing protein [Vicinamibacterales bacterium]
MTRPLPTTSPGVLGVVARDIPVRLLNYSRSGCLLETTSNVAVGTVGSLHLLIDGREVHDPIVVVRCQPIEGAGALYHVGARFLWLAPPTTGTVRRILGEAAG